MILMQPIDPHTDAIEFLRERLAHGNECLMVGNARGAITYYDSALGSFFEHRNAEELRELFHAIWNNKSVAHQQLEEAQQAQHAAMIALSLSAAA